MVTIGQPTLGVDLTRQFRRQGNYSTELYPPSPNAASPSSSSIVSTPLSYSPPAPTSYPTQSSAAIGLGITTFTTSVPTTVTQPSTTFTSLAATTITTALD